MQDWPTGFDDSGGFWRWNLPPAAQLSYLRVQRPEPDSMSFATVLETTRQSTIEAARKQPEFAVFASISVFAGDTSACFEIKPDGGVVMGDAAFARADIDKFHLWRALEQAWLLRAGCNPGRAALAAARAAAVFCAGEALPAADLPGWAGIMGAELAPGIAALARVAAALDVAADPADFAQIQKLWSMLGTAGALMETGGDIRLALDPRSALNGYGSSHRPRPWAVTFASSTASSSSERGYAAADAARLRATAALLTAGARPAVAALLAEIRAALANTYGLAPGGAVVLAASGTDTELLALAVTHLARPALPILNVLIAPEETGSGVPMAARGLHFAVDTALGHDVARAAPIAGFRPDTELANVPLRDAAGAVRPAAVVAAEVEAVVTAGVASGRRVILHVLDLSKTGLLAPDFATIRRLRAAHGHKFDIVVDACQARLSPASLQRYLALDATVLITGSKFFTGPPFAGAALIPPAVAARLRESALPAGLDAYFGRDEFPADCPAAAALPPVGNYGLALRWHAALAEMAAFFRIPPAERAAILTGFSAVVGDEIAKNPALTPLPAPPIRRAETDEAWERCQTIFGFALAAPGQDRDLTPEEARAVYRWLNADLSGALPGLPPAGRAVAARICHIGQPVKLSRPGGGAAGILRVSAGARLISGEPSHRDFPSAARIAREFADLRVVFAKIRLILENFAALQAADPQPRYR